MTDTQNIYCAPNGLEWQVGEDKEVTHGEAVKWVNGLGHDWRMPSLEEFIALYENSEGAHRTAIKSIPWVWAGESNHRSWLFDFDSSCIDWTRRTNRNKSRVFAVREKR